MFKGKITKLVITRQPLKLKKNVDRFRILQIFTKSLMLGSINFKNYQILLNKVCQPPFSSEDQAIY
jgi:hypothetical protein